MRAARAFSKPLPTLHRLAADRGDSDPLTLGHRGDGFAVVALVSKPHPVEAVPSLINHFDEQGTAAVDPSERSQ